MFQVNPLLGRQRIHLKHQTLYSSKDRSRKLKCRLLQLLFGALRVRAYRMRISKGNAEKILCKIYIFLYNLTAPKKILSRQTDYYKWSVQFAALYVER